MPADERGAKQLGKGHAASHLFQLALVLVLGVLVMAEPWPTTGQRRAVFGGFGIVYALQASPDLHLLAGNLAAITESPAACLFDCNGPTTCRGL